MWNFPLSIFGLNLGFLSIHEVSLSFFFNYLNFLIIFLLKIFGGGYLDSSTLPAELQRLLSTMRELDGRSQGCNCSCFNLSVNNCNNYVSCGRFNLVWFDFHSESVNLCAGLLAVRFNAA